MANNKKISNSAQKGSSKIKSIKERIKPPLKRNFSHLQRVIPIKGLGKVIVAYRPLGVFLKVISKAEETILTDAMFLQLTTKLQLKLIVLTNVKNVDLSDFLMIAQPQKPFYKPMSLVVSFDTEYVEAFASIVLGDPLGLKLNIIMALDHLKQRYNITPSSILGDNVRRLIEEKNIDNKLLIAKGTKPIRPIDGRLEWNVNLNAVSGAKEEEDGKIDFKKLNLFQSIEKDALIVKLIHPQSGTNGRNVFGGEIKVGDGASAKLPSGENVYFSKDMTEVHASCDGRIEIKKDWIVVSNRYVVDGDVDLSVGNIDFPGDVIIHGNVLSGFSVNSGGNIVIYGNVEAANISARLNVVLNVGVQGNSEAIIKAGENLKTGFAENAKLIANGDITADSIMQCEVECTGTLNVTRGRGLIVGGNLTVSGDVICHNMGSTGHIETNIHIDKTSYLLERIEELNHGIKRTQDKIKHLSTFIDPNSKNKTFANEILLVQNSRNDMQSQLAEINEKIHQLQLRKIHVTQKIYPNVIVYFGILTNKFKEVDQFVTLQVMESVITSLPCMYSASVTTTKK